MPLPAFRLLGPAARFLGPAASLLLAACAATTTLVGKRDLDVQTRMTATIFLEPVAPDQRSIFLQIRNTSDQPAFDLEPSIASALKARGYRIVTDPATAQYMLQANVLQIGRSSPTASEQMFASGFGGALFGGAVGAVGSRAATSETGPIIAGGLLGAAVEAVTGSAVQDVTYTIVTDLQLSERASDGMMVTESLEQDLQQGTGGMRVLRASTVTDWKRYQTRIVSEANQANLEIAEATPALVDGLSRSIAGLF